MSMVSPEISHELMLEIQKIEQGTDLERVAVISHIGMAVATAKSSEMDADAETASSSALIDLAERLSQSVNHGKLREILVKADEGFVILEFINEEYMIFGGISDPLRVGYYMEYLRNISHRFAYILAGKQITDELQREIEASRDRDFRLQQQAHAPLAESFQMDKSNETDKQAMESVLEFLKEWGGEEEKPATPNNIIGIDNDLMVGLDDLAPQPITPDQITQSQQPGSQTPPSQRLTPAGSSATTQTTTPPPVPTSPSPPQSQDLDDIFAALDSFASKPPTTSTPPVSTDTSASTSELEESMDDLLSTLDGFASEAKTISTGGPITPTSTEGESSKFSGGIPEDILADLSDIAEISTTKVTRSKAKSQKTDYPYGIPIYQDEVPPVPLEDYVSFEIGSLTGQQPDTPESSPSYSQAPATSPTYTSPTLSPSPTSTPSMGITTPPDDLQPDFESMASEYDDLDLEIEEDAMLQALEELDFDKIGKEKKGS